MQAMRARRPWRAAVALSVAAAGLGIAGASFVGSSAHAATLTVTNLSGDAAVADSLPNLVGAAAAGDTIVFDPSLDGSISLLAMMVINSDLTIDGSAATITILPPGSMIATGNNVDLTLSSVTVSTGGTAITAGPNGSVTLDSVAIEDMSTGVSTSTNTSVDVTSSTFERGSVGIEMLAGAPSLRVDGNTRFSNFSTHAIQTDNVVDVDIVDVTVDEGASLVRRGTGIRLEDVSDVVMTNTVVTRQVGRGIEIDPPAFGVTSVPVTLSGVSSTDNGDDGLFLNGVLGPVAITDTSVFSDNDGEGVHVSFGDPALTISDTTASNNDDDGFRLAAPASVDMDRVTASGNAVAGINITNSPGIITIDEATTNLNGTGFASSGIRLFNNTGASTLTSVTSSGNQLHGVEARPPSSEPLGSVTVQGSITGGRSVVDDNVESGISVRNVSALEVSMTDARGNQFGVLTSSTGPTTITDLTATTNTLDGVRLNSADGAVVITGSTIDQNSRDGLVAGMLFSADPRHPVTVDSTTADDNTEIGMRVSSAGTLTIRNTSSASDNGDEGLSTFLTSVGNVVVSDAAFDRNGRDGARLDATIDGLAGEAVRVTDSSFDGNGGDGLQIGSQGSGSVVSGTVTIAGTSFDGNTGNGIDGDESGAISVTGGSIDGNPIGVRVDDLAGLSFDGTTLSANDEAIFALNVGAVVVNGIQVDNGAPVPPSGLGVTINGATTVDVDDTSIIDLDGAGLEIANVTGTVQIDGLTSTGHTSAGLGLQNIDGATTIGTSNLDDNGGNGVRMVNGGVLSITDSTTDGNTSRGVNVSSIDSLVVTRHSSQNNTGGSATGLQAITVDGTATVTDGTYADNDGIGISLAQVAGTITIDGPTVARNTGRGVSLSGVAAAEPDLRIIGGTTVTDNTREGITVGDIAALTVTSITATDNGRDGLRASGAESVTITDSTFDDNGTNPGDDGIAISGTSGAIEVVDSFVRSNSYDGIAIRDEPTSITVTGSTLSSNGRSGFSSGAFNETTGPISFTDSVIATNVEIGVRITRAGDVQLTGTRLVDNQAISGGGAIGGMRLNTVGAVTLTDVTVQRNEGDGVFIDDATSLTVRRGIFSDQVSTGLSAGDAGPLVIDSTEFRANGNRGASINRPTSVVVTAPRVVANGFFGLSLSDASGPVTVTGGVFTDGSDQALIVANAASDITVNGGEYRNNRIAIDVDDAGADVAVSGAEVDEGTTGLSFSDITGTTTVSDVSVDDASIALEFRRGGPLVVRDSTFEDASNHLLDVSDVTGDVTIDTSSFIDGNRVVEIATVSGSLLVDSSSIHSSGGSFGVVANPSHIVEITDVAGGATIINSSIFANLFPGVTVDLIGTEATIAHSSIAQNSGFAHVRTDTDLTLDHSVIGFGSGGSSLDLVTPTGGSAPTVTGNHSFTSPGTGLGGTNSEDSPLELETQFVRGFTMLVLAPRQNSPLIDAGDPNISGEPATDQSGAARIVGGVIDVGAMEFVPPEPEPVAAIESIAPARFVDTRPAGETLDGQFEADGKLADGQQYEVQIAGRGFVPGDAEGVVMNVTAIAAEGIGFVTVHPCVDPIPTASSLNYTQGVNLANETVAGLSDDGTVCLFTARAVHLAVDVVGFVPAGSPTTLITPIRLMDTRSAGETIDGRDEAAGRTTADGTTVLSVAGRDEIPDDAAAVIVYVTAVRPEQIGFVTVHPCVDPIPTASSLNHVPGVNRGNELIASLDDDGNICLFTSASIHLTADVVGYLPAGAVNPVEPARLIDTRPGAKTVDDQNAGAGRTDANGTVTLQVTGRAEVPDEARAAIVNITAVGPQDIGFVTVHPCVDPVPVASSLNHVPGVNGANEIIATLDDEGRICIFTFSSIHVLADVVGYIT